MEISTGQTVFAVGRAIGDQSGAYVKDWELQGVFASRDDALPACRDNTYFVMPLPFGVALPHETVIVEADYPLAAKE
jgi:hypothetical protein